MTGIPNWFYKESIFKSIIEEKPMREGEMATHLDFARKQKIISIAVPNNFDESVIANFMAGADLKDYVPSVKKFSVNQLLDELVEKTK